MKTQNEINNQIAKDWYTKQVLVSGRKYGRGDTSLTKIDRGFYILNNRLGVWELRYSDDGWIVSLNPRTDRVIEPGNFGTLKHVREFIYNELLKW